MKPDLDGDVAARLLTYIDQTTDLVGVTDDQSHVLYLNGAARKRLGFGDASDLTTADLFPPAVFGRYYDEIRPVLLRCGAWHGEIPVLDAAGVAVAMEVTVVASIGPGGEITGLVTHGREVAPVARVDDSTVGPDELTGLVGRATLDDRLELALARVARDRLRAAIVFVDVDGMKSINDTFGHAVGDDVLRVFARRMTRTVRSVDTVARLGGDEFVLLFDGVADDSEALVLVGRVRDALMQMPVWTSEGEVEVTASFGVTVGEAEDDPAELMRRADVAMYRAKALGGDRVVAYDMHADAAATALVDEFAVALSAGQVRTYVQPVVDLRTGQAVGLQGLARWQHPERGLLPASAFIELIADTPMAPVVDLMVLRDTAAAARKASVRDVQRVYAHVSRKLLADPRVEHYLSEIASEIACAPTQFYIEIAQPLLVRRSAVLRGALQSLRDAGMHLVLSAVDRELGVQDILDHGFDELRLSPRLVAGAVVDASRRRAVRGTTGLARGLGLSVIAVGIEHARQRDELIDAGCDLALGHFHGRPVPAPSTGGVSA